MPLNILLFGANGQVGWELRSRLAALGEVIIPDRRRADFTRPAQLAEIVAEVRPDVIINAAAFTAVDAAEERRDEAFTVNAEAPGAIAAAARTLEVPLVHYSTDFVFAGSQPSRPGFAERGYREDDETTPLSCYGESKLAGERLVADASPEHLVLRTSWVYAARGKNFLLTILRLALERDALTIVDDQTGTPTWAGAIADATAAILAKAEAKGTGGGFRLPIHGLYHLTGAGQTTWCGFSRAILQGLYDRTGDARLHPDKVGPITTADYPTPARRPSFSVLDSSRLEQEAGVRLPPWQDQLSDCLDELVASSDFNGVRAAG